jgi:hypothetical protein
MSLDERHVALRRALAANNVGVAHLERGCYSAASDALQASMYFIKSIVGTAPLGGDSRQPPIQDTPTNASPLLCEMRHSNRVRCLFTQSDPHAAVQSVTFQICRNASYLNSVPELPSSTQVFPLVFEDSSESGARIVDDLSALSLDIVSAALLYNLAVTNLLESRRESISSERRGRHLKFSRSLMDVAMKIVSNDCAEEETALPLAILLVHGMYQALSDLGDTRSASLAADDFYRLQNAYREGWMDAEGDDDDWNADGPSFPSAAAA